MADKGRPLPKFGEWDVNDPASAEGFTVIFNKARDEKKTGGNKIPLERATLMMSSQGWSMQSHRIKNGCVVSRPQMCNINEGSHHHTWKKTG